MAAKIAAHTPLGQLHVGSGRAQTVVTGAALARVHAGQYNTCLMAESPQVDPHPPAAGEVDELGHWWAVISYLLILKSPGPAKPGLGVELEIDPHGRAVGAAGVAGDVHKVDRELIVAGAECIGHRAADEDSQHRQCNCT